MSSRAITAIELVSFFIFTAMYLLLFRDKCKTKHKELKKVVLLYLMTLSFSFFKKIDNIIFILTALFIITLNVVKSKTNERRNKGLGS